MLYKARFLGFVLLMLSAFAWANAPLATYKNTQFYYRVQYPSQLLTAQPMQNPSRRTFLSKNGKVSLTVFAASAPKNPQLLYQNIKQHLGKDAKILTYTPAKNQFFILAQKGDTLLYYVAKTSARGNINAQLMLPLSEKSTWAPQWQAIADSLAFLKVNLCDQAAQGGVDSDTISVIRVEGKATRLFSSTLYISQNCKQFQRQETIDDPDIIESKNGGFCYAISAQTLKPKLRCVKANLCIGPSICKSTTIQLIWDKDSAVYTQATPRYTTLKFTR